MKSLPLQRCENVPLTWHDTFWSQRTVLHRPCEIVGYRSKTKTVGVCRRCTPSNNKERRKDEACDEGLSITTILQLSREGNRASMATSLYIFETFWTSRLQTVKITVIKFNPTQKSEWWINFFYTAFGAELRVTWVSLFNVTDSRRRSFFYRNSIFCSHSGYPLGTTLTK